MTFDYLLLYALKNKFTIRHRLPLCNFSSSSNLYNVKKKKNPWSISWPLQWRKWCRGATALYRPTHTFVDGNNNNNNNSRHCYGFPFFFPQKISSDFLPPASSRNISTFTWKSPSTGLFIPFEFSFRRVFIYLRTNIIRSLTKYLEKKT